MTASEMASERAKKALRNEGGTYQRHFIKESYDELVASIAKEIEATQREAIEMAAKHNYGYVISTSYSLCPCGHICKTEAEWVEHVLAALRESA